MAVIHATTMTPGKLELLASWLPTQPWYLGAGRAPELSRAGGFRLDDPEGEVGIEFMVIVDAAGGQPVVYHVPLTYRAAPLDAAEHALVGTSEHGVLGRRWVYDGAHDPILVAQLLALVQGRAEPQDQSATDTPDPSVTAHFAGPGLAPFTGSEAVGNGPDGTDLVVDTAAPEGPQTLTVTRVLRPDPQGGGASRPAGTRGHVAAGWRSPDGAHHRAAFAVLR
ncbi:1,4-alpha-glucan branching protein [Streptomyces sp. NPDC003038]|uniref:maltokinase N-terminal cap-like domain-containing protein n=1 Tax=unclassified Streptomyces TaxID=2593676 RepID=UPI0033A72460